MVKKFLLIFLGIFAVAAAPFVMFLVMYSVPIIGFSIEAYKQQKRAEENMLRRTYGSVFEGSSKVHLLSDSAVASAEDGRFSVTIRLPIPESDGSGTGANDQRRFLIWAARYGEEECEILLAILASECTVVDAKSINSSDLELKFELVQNVAAHAPKPGWFAKRDAIRVDFLNNRSRPAREARRQVYVNVAAGCAQRETIRAGCLLSKIRFDVADFRGQDGSAGTRTNASATLAAHRNFDVEELVRQQRGS